MNIKKFLTLALSFTMATSVVTSCVQDDDWDTPPINCENRFGDATTTMATVAGLAPDSGFYLIENDMIFDGYVISSDEAGNFYKSIVIQDSPSNPSVGVQLSVDQSDNYADFPVGAHIRINAKGLRIAKDHDVIKLGSEDETYDIGRIPSVLLSKYVSGVCNGTALDIQTITPRELSNLSEVTDDMINTLVTVPNVQFSLSEIYPTQKAYADFIGSEGQDTDRTLEDTSGTTVIRTSGYADFASSLLPKGQGSITFVVSHYNDYQMIIRDLNDVQIAAEGERFDATPPKGGTAITYEGAFTEDFSSYSYGDEELPKYVNDPLFGTRYWQVKQYQGNKYIQLSAYNASGAVQTSFAVPIDFSAANNVTFNINYGYANGAPLKVYLSTDYTADGGITAATLTDITNEFTYPAASSSGYGTFQNAGTYAFPSTVTGNGFLIFEYTGGTGNGITTTVQIDDIVVQ